MQAGGEGAAASDITWEPSQTMCFIDILINEKAKLSPETLKKMEVIW